MNVLNRINDQNDLNELNTLNEINVKRWYVIQTKPGNEYRAENNLTSQGIETFLPLFESYQYFRGEMISKNKPLFSNYLFAKLDINAHYYKVKWTRGVSKILGIGNEPIPVSEKVIQTIKDRVGENNLVKLDEGLEEGNIVQFTLGPFKDLMGVFDKKMSDGKRVRVLLSLVGVDVPVQVSRWQIKKVA